jgi:predicted kinase
MLQLILTKGLQASGKSTWAKAWVAEAPKERVRINRDDIRRMLGPYWIPTREDLVTDIENDCVRAALIEKFNVVIDATNFRSTVEGYTSKLRSWGILDIEVTIKDFTDISVEECIKRDNLRSGSEKVGEAVIRQMFNRYLKHTL